jgi:hypothetical protein
MHNFVSTLSNEKPHLSNLLPSWFNTLLKTTTPSFLHKYTQNGSNSEDTQGTISNVMHPCPFLNGFFCVAESEIL